MPPKIFTSLPHELRQIILSYTFDNAFDQDTLLNDNLKVLDEVIASRMKKRPPRKTTPQALHICAWASTLHAIQNRTISDDLSFALGQCLRALKKEYMFDLENCQERKDRWMRCMNWGSGWGCSQGRMFSTLYHLKELRYADAYA